MHDVQKYDEISKVKNSLCHLEDETNFYLALLIKIWICISIRNLLIYHRPKKIQINKYVQDYV